MHTIRQCDAVALSKASGQKIAVYEKTALEIAGRNRDGIHITVSDYDVGCSGVSRDGNEQSGCSEQRFECHEGYSLFYAKKNPVAGVMPRWVELMLAVDCKHYEFLLVEGIQFWVIVMCKIIRRISVISVHVGGCGRSLSV